MHAQRSGDSRKILDQSDWDLIFKRTSYALLATPVAQCAGDRLLNYRHRHDSFDRAASLGDLHYQETTEPFPHLRSA